MTREERLNRFIVMKNVFLLSLPSSADKAGESHLSGNHGHNHRTLVVGARECQWCYHWLSRLLHAFQLYGR